MRQSHRIVVVAVTIVAVAIAAPVLALRGSLPTIDGRVAASGLTAPVTVERDALGVPTIAGSSRNDVAYATGYVHAQDRYFQMDLSRRMPAGRLAELVGDAALPTDRRNRLHRFEALADRMYAALPKGERELIDAYSAGVNAGLESLRVRPFEYLLLRSRPVHWQPRDTVLVVFAMYLQLNDSRAETDLRRGVLKASLPPALFSFVNSVSPEWEAPIDGQVVAAAPMPGADVYDLREHAREFAALTAARDPIMREARSPGSNNWALGGGHTASGRGLVASDMHLGLGVPNTWYRARLKVQGLEARDLAGLTLPGSPVLVAGSNGRVAWALTNSYGDYSDLVRVELAPDGAQYRSAAGFRSLIREREVLRSSSGASEVLELRLTEWGPLLDEPAARGALALRWTAHEPGATNLRWLELETVDDVDAALALVNTIGAPVQNFVCADAQGNVGWTLLGRIPLRGSGYDPTVPSDWTQPDAGWRGFLAPERYPRVVNPPGGRIWTANNRVVGGESLALIGDGSPDRGARAQQIRDALARLEDATERDMLAIQLDDRALFLERWRKLLLEVLDADALAGHPDRAVLRKVVATGEPRASAASVGYLHVRRFHELIEQRVFEALTDHGADRAPGRRSRGTEAVRGSRLAARDGAAGALARSAFLELAGVRPVGRRRDDCRHRARLRRRPPRQLQLGRAQYRQHSPPLEPRHPVARALARHAERADGRRPRHASCARVGLRCLRALRGVARGRGHGDTAHAGRSERASLVAVLPRRSRGLGAWRADPLSARADSAHADVASTG